VTVPENRVNETAVSTSPPPVLPMTCYKHNVAGGRDTNFIGEGIRPVQDDFAAIEKGTVVQEKMPPEVRLEDALILKKHEFLLWVLVPFHTDDSQHP